MRGGRRPGAGPPHRSPGRPVSVFDAHPPKGVFGVRAAGPGLDARMPLFGPVICCARALGEARAVAARGHLRLQAFAQAPGARRGGPAGSPAGFDSPPGTLGPPGPRAQGARRRPPDPVLRARQGLGRRREAQGAGRAAPAAQGRGAPRAHLRPDDPDDEPDRGVPGLQEVPVFPAGWFHQAGRPEGHGERVSAERRHLRVHALHPCRRPGHQPHRGGHGHLL
mmetsp:Transcript_989/g.2575  ORF Transcript_989/g.2575 Transcript_989/m.2575 type:complete len:223 (+) Transcript_989:2576-3244(+)